MTSNRPRALFVGHAPFDLPLNRLEVKKWDALSQVLDLRVIGAEGRTRGVDERFLLLQGHGRFGKGLSFYAALPRAIRHQVREFRADAIVAQSPFEGAMAHLAWPTRSHPVPLIVEVHGDWRMAATLYGSRWRRLLAGPAKRAGLYGLHHADAVRAASADMATLVAEELGRVPDAVFTAWLDADAFFREPPRPFPETPTALWIGVLQRSKDPAALAEAWRRVNRDVPSARLVIVGKGPEDREVEQLAHDLPERVSIIDWLDPDDIASQIDQSWVLVLPSRSEGLGRVAIEAFARGRPVIGSNVTGIRELVRHERNGLLVPPGRPTALAASIKRMLGDRGLAEGMGNAAHRDAQRFDRSPHEYAMQVRQLVDAAIAKHR